MVAALQQPTSEQLHVTMKLEILLCMYQVILLLQLHW
jgi:hypothetical protein